MLRRLLHWLVRKPAVYDWVQTMAGARKLRARLAELGKRIPQPKLAVDIGGGTGGLRDTWDHTTAYVCLDIDLEKLVGYRRNFPGGLAVLGDATRSPIGDASVDLVMCAAVAHHLDHEQFPRLFSETRRMLRPGGRFLFMDPLWAPWRLPGRLLWRYDRGSFPRTFATIRGAIEKELVIDHVEQMAIYHRYILCVARKAE